MPQDVLDLSTQGTSQPRCHRVHFTCPRQGPVHPGATGCTYYLSTYCTTYKVVLSPRPGIMLQQSRALIQNFVILFVVGDYVGQQILADTLLSLFCLVICTLHLCGVFYAAELILHGVSYTDETQPGGVRYTFELQLKGLSYTTELL